MRTRSSPGRLLALDVLRAVAVVLVLFHHVPKQLIPSIPLPEVVAAGLVNGGWIGVDLFFVLSGFLIAGLLFREHQRYGSIRCGHFFLRRGLKIYPAFYFMLALTSLVWLQERGHLPRMTWSEALFVQNYFGSVWGHTWSLAVEEHFYVFLPLLLILLGRISSNARRPFSALPGICLVLAVLVLALRLLEWNNPQPATFFKRTHLRIDALMFGVLLSYAYTYKRREFQEVARRFHWPLLVGGMWLCMPFFFLPMKALQVVYTLGFTQLYVGCGLIVVALVVRGVPSNRFTRAIGFCGRHSYSIYLWHLPYRRWGLGITADLYGGPVPPWVMLLAYFGGSIALGIVVATLIEIPVLRLRDRLLPSRSGALPVNAPSEPSAVPEEPEPERPGRVAPAPRARTGARS